MKLNEIAGGSVWIVSYEDYDDVRVMGVFSSKAAAEKAKKEMNVPAGEYEGANFITEKDVKVKEFKLNKTYTTFGEQALSM